MSPSHRMHFDTSRAWQATHLIQTLDPALGTLAVMLCADAAGDGPAFTREEWEEAQRQQKAPTPVWTRQAGRWLALGTGATLRNGRFSFWVMSTPEEGR